MPPCITTGAGAPTTSAALGLSPPGSDRRYRVEFKNWGSHERLDLDVNPEGLVAWRGRAFGFLSGDRPDVRRLQLWAEKQTSTVGEQEEKVGATEV
jgi:hypothetical protein